MSMVLISAENVNVYDNNSYQKHEGNGGYVSPLPHERRM